MGRALPCPYTPIMTSSDNKAAQTLAALDATEASNVSVLFAEILARGKAEKGSGIPSESRPTPRLSGRVYTHLPPHILVRTYTAVPHDL